MDRASDLLGEEGHLYAAHMVRGLELTLVVSHLLSLSMNSILALPSSRV